MKLLARSITAVLAVTGFLSACADDDLPTSRPKDAPGEPLVHVVRKYMRGLEEMVEIVKRPGSAQVIRADGSRSNLSAVRAADRAAYREKFGPFVPGLVRFLATADEQDVARVAVFFRPALDWDDMSKRLHSANAVTRKQAQVELRSATFAQGTDLAQELNVLGLDILRVDKAVPVVLVSGNVKALRRISAVMRANFVTSAMPRPQVLRSSPDASCGTLADSIGFHEIDSVFNETSPYNYGGTRWDDVAEEVVSEPQRIAIMEDTGDCTLNESHEAFDYIAGGSFVYSNSSPQSCTAQHGTWVASIMSGSTNGTKRGAAEAQYFYPNAGAQNEFWPYGGGYNHPPSVTCEPAAALEAYQWMVGNHEINTINESWGCLHESINCTWGIAADWEGVIQDYYARQFGVTIVKAAGNDNCGTEQNACPYTLNSICVGGIESTMDMYCKSSDDNPNAGTQDREEPDLVALAGQSDNCSSGYENVCVGSGTGSSNWEGRQGTSFAAPAVTAMIALFRERCEPNWEMEFDQRFLRAVTRTAAWAGDPDDYAYSTPTPGEDWKDGAGFLRSDKLIEFCERDENPVAGGGIDTINLNGEEGGEMPTGDADYQPEYNPPGQTQSTPMDFEFEPGPNQGFEWFLAARWNGLTQGDRVRATLSWDGCGAETPGSAPASVATDLDLFLYNETTDKYVWASQSATDSNEGFDYTVQSGENGDYRLIVAWVPGQNCDGGATEAIAWAWRLWQ